MTRKYDGTVFGQAVQERNLEDIRIYLVSAIDADPWFQSGEFDEKMVFLARQDVDPTVPYAEGAEEFRKEREEWDKPYFFRLTEWLRLNFAPNQRLAHIKEVGRAVFPAPAQTQIRSPGEAGCREGAKRARENAPAFLPLWATIALTVAAVGAVALLLRGLLFD